MSSIENGWIEWSAGPCPVPGNTLVDIRHADGQETHGVHASDLVVRGRFGFDWWAHEDCHDDAVGGFVKAYRIVEQSK